MKYLHNAQLEHLSNALCLETGEAILRCKLESYSCKMTSDDKRLYKLHSLDAPEFQALSPPQAVNIPTVGSPPTGPGSWQRGISEIYSSSATSTGGLSVSQKCDTRTLYHLTATLSASFQPDYDFSDTKSDEFSREPSFSFVADHIRDCMAGSHCEHFGRLEAALWNSVGKEVDLSECEIYSYNPDLQSDPYSEDGNLWSFNYFFFDTKLKRIVFFSCRASRTNADHDDSTDFDPDRSSLDWQLDDELVMEY